MKKRKLKNKIKKAVAVAMGVVACLSPVLFAFHKPSAIYAFLFVVSIGWTMLYLQVNGGKKNV